LQIKNSKAHWKYGVEQNQSGVKNKTEMKCMQIYPADEAERTAWTKEDKCGLALVSYF